MDLQTAQEHLDDWLAADKAVSTGSSYSIGGRSLTRADADTILNRITYWQRVVDGLMSSSDTPGIVTPSWNH